MQSSSCLWSSSWTAHTPRYELPHRNEPDQQGGQLAGPLRRCHSDWAAAVPKLLPVRLHRRLDFSPPSASGLRLRSEIQAPETPYPTSKCKSLTYYQLCCCLASAECCQDTSREIAVLSKQTDMQLHDMQALGALVKVLKEEAQRIRRPADAAAASTPPVKPWQSIF